METACHAVNFLVPHNMRRFIMLLCLLPLLRIANNHRSAAAKADFQRMTPCPSTGQHRGKCPGYVIDHIDPLCHGGADVPANMQWQTIADAKRKDIDERRLCHVSYKEAPLNAACITGPRGGRYQLLDGRKRCGC